MDHYATVYYNRGNAYLGNGDLDRALADYTQALALNPNLAAAYHSRAMAWAAMKDYDQA